MESMKRITKTKAQGIFDYWVGIFGLSNWRCKIRVLAEKVLQKQFKDTVLPAGDAAIEFDPMTEHADICMSRKCKPDELEFSVKHELGHLVSKNIDGFVESLLHTFPKNKRDDLEVQWHILLDQGINKWINIIDRARE